MCEYTVSQRNLAPLSDYKQEIWANAHETRHSISLISYAGCLGLFPVFQRKFALSVHGSLNSKNHIKPIFWGFNVVQGHRCWYPRKARQQCLLWCAASLCLSATILVLDKSTVAEIARFQGSTQIWFARTEDSLNLGGQTLHRWNLRLMPNISYAGFLLYLEWFPAIQS